MIASQLLFVLLCLLGCSLAQAKGRKNEVDFFTSAQSSIRQAELDITRILYEYEEQYPFVKNLLVHKDDSSKSKSQEVKPKAPLESVPEPLYGSPTRAPTYSSAFDSYCRSLTPTGPTNQTTTDQCETCVTAGCTWCESSDYCFANNDGCSSYESGSSGVCTLDLSGLAILIIIIIIIVIVIPCCICGIGALVLCFGVSICCFTAAKGNNNNNVNQTYNTTTANPAVQGSVIVAQEPYAQQQYGQPAYGQPAYGNSPVIVGAAQPIPATQYGGPAVVQGSVVGSMDLTKNNV